MNRRTLLASLGSLGVAGCLRLSDSQSDGTPSGGNSTLSGTGGSADSTTGPPSTPRSSTERTTRTEAGDPTSRPPDTATESPDPTTEAPDTATEPPETTERPQPDPPLLALQEVAFGSGGGPDGRPQYLDRVEASGRPVLTNIRTSPIVAGDGYFSYETTDSWSESATVDDGGFDMGDGTTELYTVEGRRLRHRKRFDTAPDGAVVTELAFENVTDEAFEVRVPDGFLSEGFSIGFAELDRPTGEYRIGVNGESVGAYADLDRFTRFSLEGADPTVTAFDDEVAITLGLVSDSASTPGVLAMVNDGDPGRIQLFVDGATFEPGEVRSWIVAHVCHEGGTAAPGEGTELFRELAS